MPRGSGTRVPPSLPIAHQTHAGLQMDASPTRFFRTPKQHLPQEPPHTHGAPVTSEAQTAGRGTPSPFALSYLHPLWRADPHFSALQLQLFHGRDCSPAIPRCTPTTTTTFISPCLSLMPNLSLCHFNYSPGNLYGGILQEHQSAKKVISRPATQPWYQ